MKLAVYVGEDRVLCLVAVDPGLPDEETAAWLGDEWNAWYNANSTNHISNVGHFAGAFDAVRQVWPSARCFKMECSCCSSYELVA